MTRLLIVDDEILTAEAIDRELSGYVNLDCKIDCVYSAEDAQEYISKQKIDIVLSDIEMPGKNGLEFLEWMKSFYPQIECIMLTCHAEFDYLRQAMRLGCFDYVLKPIDYEELIRVIQSACEKIDMQSDKLKYDVANQQEYLNTTFRNNMSKDYFVKKDSLESKIKNYIREHIMEQISVQQLAEYVNFSQAHLMKTFKCQTGISVLQCITCERMDAAKELLKRSDLSVSEVSMTVGYDNYSYFIKMFKRETGLTPMQYRKKNNEI